MSLSCSGNDVLLASAVVELHDVVGSNTSVVSGSCAVVHPTTLAPCGTVVYSSEVVCAAESVAKVSHSV